LSVFNALCASFQDPPQQCLKTLHREPAASAQALFDSSENANMVTAFEIVMLVIALVAINVLVVYCCRRRARRELQNSMNMQIESQVSQYFALTNSTKRDSKV
jgi:hypothetical protein